MAMLTNHTIRSAQPSGFPREECTSCVVCGKECDPYTGTDAEWWSGGLLGQISSPVCRSPGCERLAEAEGYWHV